MLSLTIFTSRDQLLEREREVQYLKDQIREKELQEGNMIIQIESIRRNQEEAQMAKQEMERQLQLLENSKSNIMKDWEKERKEWESKIEEIKKDTKDRPVLEPSKIMMKMMALLKKAKLLHQLKDKELNDLKEQMLQGISEP